MRALIQRVRSAQVEVDSKVISKIGYGMLTFLGVGPADSEEVTQKVIQKILKLRIFEDQDKKMNLSLTDIQGEHLIVSQFTLYGNLWEGNRPGFSAAAKPDHAIKIYQKAIELSQQQGVKTQGGQFGAEMKVSLLNDGPATFWIELDE